MYDVGQKSTHVGQLAQFKPEDVEQLTERLPIRLLALVRVLPAPLLLRTGPILERLKHLPQRQHLDQLQLVRGLLQSLCDDARQRERCRQADRQRGIRQEGEQQRHGVAGDGQVNVDPSNIRRVSAHAPVDDLDGGVELALGGGPCLLAFAQPPHTLDAVSHDREDRLVDVCGIPFPDGVAHARVACVAVGAERACGLDQLIRDLARDLEHDVEEEEGDVWVERGLRGRLGWMDEGEEISEKGRPLVDVSAKEEEGKSMRKLVPQN